MSFINQYSFVITALVIIIIFAIILFRKGIEANDVIAVGALLIGFILAFIFLRPGESTLNETDEILNQIGKGKPVFLEFQSNF
ncbi:MAG: hypothetical protein GTO18_16360 [Anaerolineales bacterium]|nr:hypothetical protein [Anaerolineales bacterium]